MKAPSDLLRLSLYQAPPVSEVVPYSIPTGVLLVELVTEGVVYFATDSGDQKLGCGALFWHVAGEKTICRTEPSAPYACLVLAFAMPRSYRREVPRLSVISDQQRTRELTAELLHSHRERAADPALLTHYAYYRLLWETHRCQVEQSESARPPAIRAALSFLDTDFHRSEVGVFELAAAAGVSESRLHVLFREYVGESPHQALLTRRLREGRSLLSRTDMAIKAISTRCGFANIETFYRAFRRLVGTTPHEFRQSHRLSILETP